MPTTQAGLLSMLTGILVMLGAALNWRIVTGSGKLLNLLFGDTIARVIYFLVGLVISVLGVDRLIGASWF